MYINYIYVHMCVCVCVCLCVCVCVCVCKFRFFIFRGKKCIVTIFPLLEIKSNVYCLSL